MSGTSRRRGHDIGIVLQRGYEWRLRMNVRNDCYGTGGEPD